jgi:hypothetical protein
MKMFMYLVLFLWIGVINAHEESIEKKPTYENYDRYQYFYIGDGISFSLRAARPGSYDHSVGGGSYFDGVGEVNSQYYGCRKEVVSLFLQISTYPSVIPKTPKSRSSEWLIELVPRYFIIGVENNCLVSKTDRNYTCTESGKLVVPDWFYTDNGPILKFTGLGENTTTVIRIDLVLGCATVKLKDCSSVCVDMRRKTICNSVSAGYFTRTFISTAQSPETPTTSSKRDIHETQKHGEDKGRDVIFFFNDYIVDGVRYRTPLVSLEFKNNCSVFSCEVVCERDDERLQEENLEIDDNSKQQTTRGLNLSSSQLGGIIGGCLVVGFIVTLMIVVIIKRRSYQQQFNTETLITLQIPLTEQIN